MELDIALLECTELWNKETRTLPKYKLTYKENIWEFREVNRGAASSQARWFLDVLIFRQGNPKWYDGIDKKRISYKWKEEW